jgi:hypothetical protein
LIRSKFTPNYVTAEHLPSSFGRITARLKIAT